MKIDTDKKAVVGGAVYAVVVFLIFAGFTYVINYLTGGQPFVTKAETFKYVNGISSDLVDAIAIVLAAIIPIFLLRYRSINGFFVSFGIAAVTYVVLFAAMYLIMCLTPIGLVLDCPLNSFDALVYGLVFFPIGSVIGTATSGLISLLINRKMIEC